MTKYADNVNNFLQNRGLDPDEWLPYYTDLRIREGLGKYLTPNMESHGFEEIGIEPDQKVIRFDCAETEYPLREAMSHTGGGKRPLPQDTEDILVYSNDQKGTRVQIMREGNPSREYHRAMWGVDIGFAFEVPKTAVGELAEASDQIVSWIPDADTIRRFNENHRSTAVLFGPATNRKKPSPESRPSYTSDPSELFVFRGAMDHRRPMGSARIGPNMTNRFADDIKSFINLVRNHYSGLIEIYRTIERERGTDIAQNLVLSPGI